MIGIGVIIRDEFLRLLVRHCKQFSTHLQLRQWRLDLHAVEFSRDTGLRQVIFEGDSKHTVQALFEIESSNCSYGQVIDNAKVVLKGFGAGRCVM